MRRWSARARVEAPADARVGPEDGDATVYLRRRAEGWSVSLDDAVAMVCADEERAFQYACSLMRREGFAPRRLEILSSPSTANDALSRHQSASVVVE